MTIRKLACGLLMTLLLASCSSKKNTLAYFQDIDPATFDVPVDPTMFDPKIEPFDELSIVISSLKPELTIMYNLPLENIMILEDGKMKPNTNVPHSTYIVSTDGDIVIPVIGKIHVAGMTVEQLTKKIEDLVSKDVDDPMVAVKLLNFKINVAGEVARPGSFNVKTNRVSLLDALAMAGDLTPYGERERVILVREENGKRQVHLLNLADPDVLKSPYFYLKQNDYVYVTPNIIRNDIAKYNQNNSYKLSVISTCVSGASVIASLVIALAIR